MKHTVNLCIHVASGNYGSTTIFKKLKYKAESGNKFVS